MCGALSRSIVQACVRAVRASLEKDLFPSESYYIFGDERKTFGCRKTAALLLLLCGCFLFRYTASYVCIYALSGSGEHTMAYIHYNIP